MTTKKEFLVDLDAQREFIIVGDNNYWYAQGHTKPDLKQAKQSLKLTARAIKKGEETFSDEEMMPEPATLYLYIGELIDSKDL